MKHTNYSKLLGIVVLLFGISVYANAQSRSAINVSVISGNAPSEKVVLSISPYDGYTESDLNQVRKHPMFSLFEVNGSDQLVEVQMADESNPNMSTAKLISFLEEQLNQMEDTRLADGVRDFPLTESQPAGQSLDDPMYDPARGGMGPEDPQ